jgi:hypothetical protein
MSTIIVAALLVASVVLVCYVLVRIHNKQKREAMNQLLDHFRQTGAKHALSFSSQEVLNDRVLGLDGVNRKVLVVTREENAFDSFIIDVNEIKNCTVKKVYGTIKAGDLKDHRLEQYLEKIVLHFEMTGKPSVEVPFFSHANNHLYETQELEQKARHWETFLAKMQKPLKKTG